MLFALKARQDKVYLHQAGEIIFDYRDHKAIPDYFERYPNANIILKILPKDEAEVKWNLIEDYKVLGRGKFIICAYTISLLNYLKENDYKYYYDVPINSYSILDAITSNYDCCYIRLDAPLFFEMDKLSKKYNIRVTPNICYSDVYPRENGIHGTWIRPEDIDAYAGYVSAVDFDTETIEQERALFRIYSEDKKWAGPINLIIKDFNCPGVLNRMIPDELSQRRISCGQICKRLDRSCAVCNRFIALANPSLYTKFIEGE